MLLNYVILLHALIIYGFALLGLTWLPRKYWYIYIYVILGIVVSWTLYDGDCIISIYERKLNNSSSDSRETYIFDITSKQLNIKRILVDIIYQIIFIFNILRVMTMYKDDVCIQLAGVYIFAILFKIGIKKLHKVNDN